MEEGHPPKSTISNPASQKMITNTAITAHQALAMLCLFNVSVVLILSAMYYRLAIMVRNSNDTTKKALSDVRGDIKAFRSSFAWRHDYLVHHLLEIGVIEEIKHLKSMLLYQSDNLKSDIGKVLAPRAIVDPPTDRDDRTNSSKSVAKRFAPGLRDNHSLESEWDLIVTTEEDYKETSDDDDDL
jgi:hypothetical protein